MTGKALGIICASYNDTAFKQLTESRSVATLPFGGRYRLIDFPLSNMVNAGIGTVGLIAPRLYVSLMDHVGDGKPWGLSKKEGGEWGMKNLPLGFRPLIQTALDEYENGTDAQYDQRLAAQYAQYMLDRIMPG